MSDTKAIQQNSGLQIIDIGWRYEDDKTNKISGGVSYIPRIVLWDNDSKEQKKIDLKDYNFNFVLSEDRFCPGYDDANGYNTCKFNNILVSKSYDQCPYCDKKQGFRSAFLFGQDPNENMQKYLSQEHYIYLAYFQPDIIKVGTSSMQRKFIRPVEQDALIYAYIAKSDGFNIQKLEHSISKQLGLTEFVASKLKFKYIGAKPDLDKAEKLIQSSYSQIEFRFNKTDEFKDWVFDDINIIDISDPKWIFYPVEQMNKLEESDRLLVGTFQGLRGKLLFFKNSDQLYYQDIRTMIGRKIVDYKDSHQYNSENNLTEQQSLF